MRVGNSNRRIKTDTPGGAIYSDDDKEIEMYTHEVPKPREPNSSEACARSTRSRSQPAYTLKDKI